MHLIACLYLSEYQTAKEIAENLLDYKGRLVQRKKAFIALTALVEDIDFRSLQVTAARKKSRRDFL
jgi:hypothetical protein